MLLLRHNEPIQISISGALASRDGLLAHTQTGVEGEDERQDASPIA